MIDEGAWLPALWMSRIGQFLPLTTGSSLAARVAGLVPSPKVVLAEGRRGQSTCPANSELFLDASGALSGAHGRDAVPD